MNAIETFRLTKEFIAVKSIYNIILYPFQKKKPFLAVNNITMQVKQGEIFCLMGPNGSGKTTLLKILSCLILPTRGRARVYGHDILKEEQKAKSAIGLVSGDERSFYWRLTLRQNLSFFGALYNLSNAQIKRKIEYLGHLLELDMYLDKRFQECSSGIKQRLAIARSLLGDAKILFMDEPMKSLDPISAINFKDFIKRKLVQEQGKTIFFVTHQFNEAEDFADRIAIMYKGEIRTMGTLNELRSSINCHSGSLEDIYKQCINPDNN